jgi:hypothetical protein
MKFDKQKKCPKCHYSWPFDFSFCPHCGKKYRKIWRKDENKADAMLI